MAGGKSLVSLPLPSALLLALVCVSVAHTEAHTFTAKYFSPPYTSAACGPEFVAAVKDEMLMGVPKHVWNSGRACGKRLAVSCVSNGKDSPCIKSGGEEAPAVIATIVEHAADDIILLSKEAFAKLAPLKVGLITVNVTLAPSDSAPVPLVSPALPPVVASPPLAAPAYFRGV
ncbi:hypothetical protein Mapa_005066 [Marchantia paleacea]|nr:hypothetical protein Mapa_005066 [Marchantia paleacea]